MSESVGLPSSELTWPVANFDAFGQNVSDFFMTIFAALQVGNCLALDFSP